MKVIEAIINAEVVKHLTSHDILSNKQYGFRYARSSADVITTITEYVYQNLDYNCEASSVAPDILRHLIVFGMLVFYISFYIGDDPELTLLIEFKTTYIIQSKHEKETSKNITLL